jgi:hypothetical protein
LLAVHHHPQNNKSSKIMARMSLSHHFIDILHISQMFDYLVLHPIIS